MPMAERPNIHNLTHNSAHILCLNWAGYLFAMFQPRSVKSLPFRSSMHLLYQPLSQTRSTWLFGVRVFYLLLELGYCPYPKTSPRARTPRQHKPSQSRPLEVQAPRPGLGTQPLSPNTTTKRSSGTFEGTKQKQVLGRAKT